jgi:hypothetical protein
MQRVARIVQAREPLLPALLPLALHGTAKHREIGARELKLVLQRYLAPLEDAEQGASKVNQP